MNTNFNLNTRFFIDLQTYIQFCCEYLKWE